MSKSNSYAFFVQESPKVMAALIARFGLDVIEGAAITGNTGHETGGYRFMQELHPVVAGSAGGLGLCQWTGPRRRAYVAFCSAKNLDPNSIEAGIAFLIHELETTEKRGLDAVRRPGTLEDKVKAFENAFERAGVKAYASRSKYARLALDAYSAKPVSVPLPSSPTAPAQPVEEKRTRMWTEQRLAPFEIVAIQKRLTEMGFGLIVGEADGLWGPRTAAAVYALQYANEGREVLGAPIHADGHFGPATKELLALGREASDQPAPKETTMLAGKKTYLIAAGSLVFAVAGVATGHLDLNAGLQIAVQALAAMGLRDAIAKSAL